MIYKIVQCICCCFFLVKAEDMFQNESTMRMWNTIPSSMNASRNLIKISGFDECLAMNGKYCLLQIDQPDIKLKLGCSRHLDFQTNLFRKLWRRRNEINESNCTNPNMKQIIGWCFPNVGPVSNISHIVAPVLNISKELMQPLANTGICQTMDALRVEFNYGDIGAMYEFIVVDLKRPEAPEIFYTIFFSVIFIIITISTMYDFYIGYFEKDSIHLILLSFSLKTNVQKLLAVGANPNDLPCLHGVRFLSMMWILLSHRFEVTIQGPIENFSYLHEWAQSIANVYLTYTFVSVDAILLWSGLLVAYSFLVAIENGEKFNIISFYLHKYIRQTPALACVILVHATLLERLGTGPFWLAIIPNLSDPCQKFWWTNLLYIQNYYNPEQICISQSWYVATDMQLYILSPLILLPLCKWPKKTIYICFVLVIGSIVSAFTVSYYYDLTAFLMQADTNYIEKYNNSTHTRYGPWLMGLMLGYHIFLIKKTEYIPPKLTPVIVGICWFTSFALLTMSLFASYPLFYNHNTLGAAFYNGLHRHIWTLGLCWIVYACVRGYGGLFLHLRPINSFLSWSAFEVLARLAYGMYLVHFCLQYYRVATRRFVFFLSDSTFVNEVFNDFCYTVLLAAFLALVCELPVLAIESAFKKYNKVRCKNTRQIYSI